MTYTKDSKADCKSAGYAFDGSNPSPTTTFPTTEDRLQIGRLSWGRSPRRQAGSLSHATTTRSRSAESCPFVEPVGRQMVVSLGVNAVLRSKLIFVFQPFVGGFGDLNFLRFAG